MLQGILLVGFDHGQGEAARAWLNKMEADFPVSYCAPHLLDNTVRNAVCNPQDITKFRNEAYQDIKEVMPKLALLSGVSEEEAIAIAEHWEEFTGE
jgi:hypothetical protein